MRYIGAKVFDPQAGIEDEHGWFTANGLTKFGPRPKREAPAEPTWPPRKLERAQETTAVAREHLTASPNWSNKKAE